MNGSMNVVNDTQKEYVVKPKLVQPGQKEAGEFSFDDRDNSLDFGAFAVKDSGKLSAKFSDNGMKHTSGTSTANANRISRFEIRADVAMIGQRVEAFVQGQSSDSKPRRFFLSDGFEFSEVARRSPADVLTENQKSFFFHQKSVFDERPRIPFALRIQGFVLVPSAPEIMRSGIAQTISRAVAQGIFFPRQSLFQILQKMQEQLLEQLSSQALVKLLERRVVGTLQKAQKLLKPGIAQDLFFGLSVRPFVIPSQKHQSQKLTLPICFLRKLTRVIFNYFLAKLKAYQDKLFVARQWFHESSSFPALLSLGELFVYFKLRFEDFNRTTRTYETASRYHSKAFPRRCGCGLRVWPCKALHQRGAP